MSHFTQGTTPAIPLSVDADVTAYHLYITFDNYKKQLTVENDRITMSYSDGKTQIIVPLTQEETLAFGTGTCEIQIRGIHDGTAIATNAKTIDVLKVLKDGVIDE